MLHQVVVDLRSGIGLTHNEVPVSQIPPRDLTPSREFMIAGQCHIDSLIPEMGNIAAVRYWLACQEGDIQPMPLN
jgi:hypothetical protein